MSDLDRNPYIDSLGMTLGEANKKFGSYVMVAIEISRGGTVPTEGYKNLIRKEQAHFEKQAATAAALLELMG